MNRSTIQVLLKGGPGSGPRAGHEFRGNQWTARQAEGGFKNFIPLSKSDVRGLAHDIHIAGGAMNNGLKVVTLADGNKAVIKNCNTITSATHEVLQAKVGRILDVPIRDAQFLDPENDRHEIILPFVAGDTVAEKHGWGAMAENNFKPKSVSFLDDLTGNVDRHGGNMILHGVATKPNNNVVGIDGGEAFTHFWADPPNMKLLGNPSDTQVATWTKGLQGLRSEFENYNMGDAYGQMMDKWNRSVSNYKYPVRKMDAPTIQQLIKGGPGSGPHAGHSFRGNQWTNRGSEGSAPKYKYFVPLPKSPIEESTRVSMENGQGIQHKFLDKATLKDGTRVVLKGCGDNQSGREWAAHEVLSAQIGKILDLPIRDVEYMPGSVTDVMMAHVEGDIKGHSHNYQEDNLPKIRFLDELTGNGDRHGANIIVDPKGNQIGIDGSSAWSGWLDVQAVDAAEFATALDNPTEQQISSWTSQLKGLRNQFVKAGMVANYQSTMHAWNASAFAYLGSRTKKSALDSTTIQSLMKGGPGSGPRAGHSFRGNQWTNRAGDDHKNFLKLSPSEVGEVERDLHGGAMNNGIQVVKLKNGNRAVVKSCRDAEDANREVLQAKVGDILDVPIRDVQHVPGSDTDIMMPFLDGKTVTEEFMDGHTPSVYGNAPKSIEAFDTLIGNWDRNGGNMISTGGHLDQGGKVIGIDGGMAFDRPGREVSLGDLGITSMDQVNKIDTQIRALQPEFESAGLGNNYSNLLRNWNSSVVTYQRQVAA